MDMSNPFHKIKKDNYKDVHEHTERCMCVCIQTFRIYFFFPPGEAYSNYLTMAK